ncbi:MAG: hypothetical protein A2X94_03095 [Bdellovibrionales bacterium GWB1_55_8]|nr:MAG: hypothetical protein A2X94_03095 [Bdellovibrionales bacterium GWB1_55_8]
MDSLLKRKKGASGNLPLLSRWVALVGGGCASANARPRTAIHAGCLNIVGIAGNQDFNFHALILTGFFAARPLEFTHDGSGPKRASKKLRPMEESQELANFYRGVASWPTSEPDLIAAATRICKTCKFPLVALASYPSAISAAATESTAGEQIAVGFLEARPPEPAALGVLKEFLRKHVKFASEQCSGELQNLPITRELGTILSGFPSVRHLVLVPVCGEVWAGPSIREGRVRRDFGWILVGSSKALDAQQEVLLVSVAQRLSELAEISQMEAVISVRGQFLSIASHELKTPLTSIYGILQLQERMLRLKKEGDSETVQLERQQSFLRMVIRQVERLNELIDGLLDVSRIQNGRFMVEPSEIDVSAVLKEAIAARLNVIADEAGVKLHLDAPDDLVAWVDPVRLEEVITNLVMNAIRFSPEGGAVWIRLKGDADSFHFSVRDQGPSVSMEDRERLFQPFERAQRTARLGGLGLGLFISRQIAQLHGGNVSLIESVPGKGNVFEAYFPARQGNSRMASA